MEPFAVATIQGIDFTFERHRCGQWCRHEGIGIGGTNHEKATTGRIGVCPVFYPSFSAKAWENGQEGTRHIRYILELRQEKAEKEALRDEATARSGDSIYQEYKSQDNSYTFRITGLTRAQAIRAYKEALAVIAVE